MYAATLIDVGITSFDDCDMFTWSFGCTVRPSERDATVAITSFRFMFVLVPLPVWKIETGNWSAKRA